MDIICSLTSKDEKKACALSDKIIAESNETDVWYEYFDDFLSHITDENQLLQDSASRHLRRLGKQKRNIFL